MEFSFSQEKISMEKIMSDLDRFVFNFCNLLDKQKIKYVIVSGYVAIVFGRSRNTEDIDILVEKISFDKFQKLWDTLKHNYDCINAGAAKEAYFDYLLKKTAVRFAEKGKFIPNFEFKFTKNADDKYSINNAVTLQINKDTIRISPLEMQVGYKLFLGSSKDIEDARFLFKLFKDRLDKEQLKGWMRHFNIPPKIVKKLGADL